MESPPMKRGSRPSLFGAALPACLLFAQAVFAAGPPLPVPDDIKEFRTVDKAITTRVSAAAAPTVSQPGYLGISVEPGTGGLIVSSVEPGSPAAAAGIQTGDILRGSPDTPIADVASLGELVRTR